MTGIRKRVSIGFLSIIVLLFFSGLVSLFELNHMSIDIEAILYSNRKSIELSEGMLDAIRANDRAVIRYAVLRDTVYADSCNTRSAAFLAAIENARKESAAAAAPVSTLARITHSSAPRSTMRTLACSTFCSFSTSSTTLRIS